MYHGSWCSQILESTLICFDSFSAVSHFQGKSHSLVQGEDNNASMQLLQKIYNGPDMKVKRIRAMVMLRFKKNTAVLFQAAKMIIYVCFPGVLRQIILCPSGTAEDFCQLSIGSIKLRKKLC